MEGGNMVVRVKRETVVACMTCSLCDNLLRDATTISECLHTFCRKCIYEKITEEEIENCPVCDIDLGGTPLEKLKPDHILQDLRTKLFPLKRKRESVSSNTLPARRKERSISSLVVNTPRVSAQAGTTGKRTKTATRKDVRGSGSFTKRAVKKEEEFGDDNTESASSPETLKKFTQNKRQVKKSSYAEPNQSLSNRRNKSADEPWDSKLHSWKPLNFLVEVANGTEDPKSEHGNASHNDVEGSKTKTKEKKRKCKLEEENSNNGATSLNQERRKGPVWFSLVASTNQDGETSLPQIPANYLRIRDGSIPVSHIQKYLVKKLDLKSETEVEIRCMGELVLPTLQLHSLVDLWLETTSKHERVAASVGASAKEFVMVLVYGLKLPESNN
ncbi:PREDICTED: E3 ubiquitin protein ligase DRIP2-like isoform X3 [Camelina sativa]|uniref:E3 ubiquitin protein ligase DRIP2-like isoform X3 n=1 Tax=Camelina sativa TaxID=90675 RepID=A0ABM0SPJ1_CAMSA|nr:PREDICTED: E3 ubiquitin protein ligase DRIP2-like isoform X3 [Camelina sativa]